MKPPPLLYYPSFFRARAARALRNARALRARCARAARALRARVLEKLLLGGILLLGRGGGFPFPGLETPPPTIILLGGQQIEASIPGQRTAGG